MEQKWFVFLHRPRVINVIEFVKCHCTLMMFFSLLSTLPVNPVFPVYNLLSCRHLFVQVQYLLISILFFSDNTKWCQETQSLIISNGTARRNNGRLTRANEWIASFFCHRYLLSYKQRWEIAKHEVICLHCYVGVQGHVSWKVKDNSSSNSLCLVLAFVTYGML